MPFHLTIQWIVLRQLKVQMRRCSQPIMTTCQTRKTSALFTNNYDQAPEEVIRYMKEYFEMAQENKSPLWQWF